MPGSIPVSGMREQALMGEAIGARPQRIRPPQSPGARWPAGMALVNTMGAAAVPSAWIVAPRLMMSVPFVSLSPKITVPGSIVSVTPCSTSTKPLIR